MTKRVARLLAGFLGGVEHPRERRLQIELPCPAAFDLRTLGERSLDGAQRLARIAAGAVDQPARQALRVVEQHFQQMVGGELLVALAKGQRLRGLHEAAGAVRVFLDVHSLPPSACSSRPEGARRTIVIGFPCRINDLRQGGLPGPSGARRSGYGSHHGAVKGV